MKKFLLLFCLLLSPLSLSAQLLKADKNYLLEKAKEHRRQAMEDLSAAEDICWYIPDLQDRKHLKAIIHGCAGAALVSSPIKMIMAVGTSLIGSMALEAYEEYCELRELLASCAHHFEMANFYTDLSLKVECQDLECFRTADYGTKAFLNAINYMILCESLAYSIQDEWERSSVLDRLQYQREFILKQIDSDTKKLSKSIADWAYGFYEDMGEILIYVDDDVLVEELTNNVYTVWESLKSAEKFWGIN